MLKYKIKISDTSGVTHTHINIPIVMENQMVDQSEIIDRKFVSTEVKKAINPIIDYEKAKFKPLNVASNSISPRVEYYVVLSTGNDYFSAGFTDDDLKRRSNAFENTFLTLNFYDTDKLMDQRLLTFITLFSNIYDPEDADNLGNVTSADGKLLKFMTFNEQSTSSNPSEGFNIFYFKDEVLLDGPPVELFMKGVFNNAKTGKSTNLMTKSGKPTIDNLVNQLHTKYLLKRSTSWGYYYEIDKTYTSPPNVGTGVGGALTVTLHEIDAS